MDVVETICELDQANCLVDLNCSLASFSLAVLANLYCCARNSHLVAGHVIPRLEGEKLQVMRQFLTTQQMVAQVKHESSKL